MNKVKKPERRHQTNFRLRPECIEALEKASNISGKSKTSIVEEGIALAISKILREK